MTKTVSYQDTLFKYLKDPKIAAGYLSEAVTQYKDNDEESLKMLLLCLRNIALAQGGMTKLAKSTGLGRESLYKTLSEYGNPQLGTLKKITSALGFDIAIIPKENRDK